MIDIESDADWGTANFCYANFPHHIKAVENLSNQERRQAWKYRQPLFQQIAQ